jgi:hypothetical protein
MPKLKRAGSKKNKGPGANRGLFACTVVIVLGFALIFFLFYGVLQSGK